MKEFRGTKTQWELDAYRESSRFTLNGGLIDVWYGMSSNQGEFVYEPEAEANARLIAAAPELLDVAQEALRMYEKIEPAGGWQHVHDGLKYAINKALGE